MHWYLWKNSTGGMNVWSENLNGAKFLVFVLFYDVHIKKGRKIIMSQSNVKSSATTTTAGMSYKESHFLHQQP